MKTQHTNITNITSIKIKNKDCSLISTALHLLRHELGLHVEPRRPQVVLDKGNCSSDEDQGHPDSQCVEVKSVFWISRLEEVAQSLQDKEVWPAEE